MEREEHVIESLPGYALGSLSAQERSEVEQHLERCPVCRLELEAYQGVVDRLPLAVPVRTPPVHLKQAIMNQALREAKQTRKPAQTAALPWWKRLSRSLSAPIPAWGLVAVFVVLAALLAANLFFLRQNLQLASHPTGVFQVARLEGTTTAPGASGLLVLSGDGRSGTLVVDGLPQLQDGQQYQLWLIRDGKRTSGGVFSVDHRGYSSLWVYSPLPLNSYQQFGVTVEPQGGSPGPTGSKVLGGSL